MQYAVIYLCQNLLLYIICDSYADNEVNECPELIILYSVWDVGLVIGTSEHTKQ